MNQTPTAANSTRIATLTATITVSERPMALAPKALSSVSATTAATARDFTSTGDDGVDVKVAA